MLCLKQTNSILLAFLGPYQYHHHHHHQLRLQVQLVQVKTEKTQQDCGAVTILIATTTCNSLTSFSQKIVTIDLESTYDKLNLLEVNVTMLIDDRAEVLFRRQLLQLASLSFLPPIFRFLSSSLSSLSLWVHVDDNCLQQGYIKDDNHCHKSDLFLMFLNQSLIMS